VGLDNSSVKKCACVCWRDDCYRDLCRSRFIVDSYDKRLGKGCEVVDDALLSDGARTVSDVAVGADEVGGSGGGFVRGGELAGGVGDYGDTNESGELGVGCSNGGDVADWAGLGL
jgi:hypothetical protein